MSGQNKCSCIQKCDCQNPPPDNWDGENGVWHISNECPIHNWNPIQIPIVLYMAGFKFF